MDGLVNQLIEEAKGVLEKNSFVWKKASEELPDYGKYKYIILLSKSWSNTILLCRVRQYSNKAQCWVPCNHHYDGIIKNDEILYWMPFDFWTKFELPQALTE